MDAAAEPTESAAEPKSEGPKSEGQQLLERLLTLCLRINQARLRLDQVRGSIAAPKLARAPAEPARAASTTATSFFEGLGLLADSFEQVAGELDRGVDELAKLF